MSLIPVPQPCLLGHVSILQRQKFGISGAAIDRRGVRIDRAEIDQR